MNWQVMFHNYYSAYPDEPCALTLAVLDLNSCVKYYQNHAKGGVFVKTAKFLMINFGFRPKTQVFGDVEV